MESPQTTCCKLLDAEAENGIEEPQRSPEQLAAQCQAGCRDSFGALVEVYQQRVFNFLLRMTGHRQDSEDLTQETFVRAYRCIGQFRASGSFSTWLFAIARRVAANHWRSAKSWQQFDPGSHGGVALDNPAEVLENEEQRTSLLELARRLKPHQFQALWLRYAEGLAVADVARVMNTNQLRVRVLLHRARRQLARDLDHGSKT